MPKPKIFVSSTYHDLKYIRKDLKLFIEQMGYEAILFEEGSITFRLNTPLDESCYKDIENCQMQILIIGGRYGSPASENKNTEEHESDKNPMYEYYNSITKKEYEKAREKKLPIFIFVEKGVYAEYGTYRENKDNETIKYAHVDNINIFKLLDEIISWRPGVFVKDFETLDDITNWLKQQWAGLFCDYLVKKSAGFEMENISSQVSELKSIVSTLKEYTEAMMTTKPENYSEIIAREQKKLEDEKIERFRKEKLIEVLKDKYNLTRSSTFLFEAFKNSQDIKEFLERINLPEQDIKSFLDKYFDDANREYLSCKERYLRIK